MKAFFRQFRMFLHCGAQGAPVLLVPGKDAGTAVTLAGIRNSSDEYRSRDGIKTPAGPRENRLQRFRARSWCGVTLPPNFIEGLT
jgi:hypothetical protein